MVAGEQGGCLGGRQLVASAGFVGYTARPGQLDKLTAMKRQLCGPPFVSLPY